MSVYIMTERANITKFFKIFCFNEIIFQRSQMKKLNYAFEINLHIADGSFAGLRRKYQKKKIKCRMPKRLITYVWNYQK